MRPPRLRTLLLVGNLAVLALPLSGLWALRLYESALVRQTESELIAQAAVLAAAFRQQLPHEEPEVAPGLAFDLARRPGLDLADDPVGPPPPAPAAGGLPEPRAAAIGRALAPVLRDAQAVTLAALRLTDAKGVVVASTGADAGLSLAGWDEVAQVLAGAPLVTAMRKREAAQKGDPGVLRTAGLRVFVAMPVLGPAGVAGAVVLSRTPRDVGQAIRGKRWQLAGLAALLLGAGAAVAAGLSRLVTRPLAVVVEQARRVSMGAQATPLRHPGTREVAELSEALTRMAATLDRRARYITAFAASVSHEFKTPLAALRGASELLDDDDGTMPAPERAKLLAIVGASGARMERLVRRLLDLARADMMPGGAGAIAVGPVLARVAARYDAVQTQAQDATVALAPDALEAVLASLLDNACAHGGGAATVRVEAEGGWTRIEVSDTGPGVSEANRTRVFEPFFTTAREQGGTGLGLPIVRAIATGAGGTAELAHGSTFRVTLPSGPGGV